jgi:phosphoadenosine phosphosulfate reductase
MAIQSDKQQVATTIQSLNETLTRLNASERLQEICTWFSSGIVFSTSLGLEDQVLTAMIAEATLPIQLFTLDTGRLFQETYDVLELTRQRYKLPIAVYFPDAAQVQELVNEKGPNSFYLSVEDRKTCCRIRKVEPLTRALKNASIWITGLRADQNENRRDMHFVEWDAAHEVIKVNPLMDWREQQVQDYIAQHRIPVNALHKQGYPSIGCAPCTRAIEAGEHPRAGRWWWETDKKECGLHTSN